MKTFRYSHVFMLIVFSMYSNLKIQAQHCKSIAVSASQTLICIGTNATLTASGVNGTQYSWSTGSLGNVLIVSPTVTTTYTVTGKKGNCLDQKSITINVTPLPNVKASGGTICSGESFTIVASGADSYTYSSGSAVVSPTADASYTVTGSNNGCPNTASAVIHVLVNPLPVIAVNSGSICEGESFTLTPSGAATYTFSGGSAVVSPTTTTSYSVMGTSSEGCISAGPAISKVTVFPLPIISVNSGSICAGESFTIYPTGASTYSFTCGSAVVNPPSTTSYSVVGTSAEGCVSASPAVCNVYVNPLPIANAGPDQTIYYGYGATQCATLTGNAAGVQGPCQYTWCNGANTQSTSVCPTASYNYTLTVTANGCSGSDQVTVNVLDVSCKNDKVIVCHNGHEICIASPAVAAHLAHGDVLGPCNTATFTPYYSGPISEQRTAFTVYPNPNTGSFEVEIAKKELNAPVKIEILNSIGQVRHSETYEIGTTPKQYFEMDNSFGEGVYFVRLTIGNEVQVTKLILLR